jgi:hypothetical protein
LAIGREFYKMKSLLTLFIIVCAAIAQAQPVLTSNNIPAAGSVLTYEYAAMPPQFPIVPGPSQTWNFTDSNPEGVFSIEFIAASSVPAAAFVPGCDFVLKYIYDESPEAEYSFASLSPSAWLSLGSTTDINIAEDIYEVPETFFQLPITMGSSYTIVDTYSYSYYVGNPEADSAKIVSIDSVYCSVDAYGELTLNGTPYQVLVQKIETVQRNLNYTYLGGVWTYQDENGSTDFSYQFIDPAVGGAVMAFSIETDNQGSEIWHNHYLTSSIITSNENNAKIAEFNLFPNPANSLVNISFPNKEDQIITIVDISGKLVKSINSNNHSAVSIDVSDLANGLYFVNVSNKQGNVSVNKKLIIQ